MGVLLAATGVFVVFFIVFAAPIIDGAQAAASILFSG